jgi:uncharacterized membrane protein YeaQ/YmgE (transglycosylase-associated protein family)
VTRFLQPLAGMDIILLLVVGLVAGVLASVVVRGAGFGLLGDIVLGIVGAFVGSWTFRQLGWHAPFAGTAGAIAVAFIGAVVVLLVFRLIRSSSRGGRR